MTRSIAHMMAAGSLGAVFLVVTMDHASGQTRSRFRPTLGRIERLDPALDAIVAPDARMEVIANGFDWTEGPLWIKADGGQLLFSDIPPNRILSWKEGRGTQIYLEQSGYLGPIPRTNNIPPDEPGSNGLTLDPQGRLVLASTATGRWRAWTRRSRSRRRSTYRSPTATRASGSTARTTSPTTRTARSISPIRPTG